MPPPRSGSGEIVADESRAPTRTGKRFSEKQSGPRVSEWKFRIFVPRRRRSAHLHSDRRHDFHERADRVGIRRRHRRPDISLPPRRCVVRGVGELLSRSKRPGLDARPCRETAPQPRRSGRQKDRSRGSPPLLWLSFHRRDLGPGVRSGGAHGWRAVYPMPRGRRPARCRGQAWGRRWRGDAKAGREGNRGTRQFVQQVSSELGRHCHQRSARNRQRPLPVLSPHQ